MKDYFISFAYSQDTTNYNKSTDTARVFIHVINILRKAFFFFFFFSLRDQRCETVWFNWWWVSYRRVSSGPCTVHTG